MSDAHIPGQSTPPKRKRSKTPPPISATKPASKRKAAAKSKPAKTDSTAAAAPADAEERWRLIAETAYRRAEMRGFAHGDPVTDWLEAEREIDERLRRA